MYIFGSNILPEQFVHEFTYALMNLVYLLSMKNPPVHHYIM